MDRISDGDLSWLRGHVEANRISGFNKESVDTWDDILRVIDELRERRAADNPAIPDFAQRQVDSWKNSGHGA
jgi:uncharacterized protein YihD (DUF1040 family)